MRASEFPGSRKGTGAIAAVNFSTVGPFAYSASCLLYGG